MLLTWSLRPYLHEYLKIFNIIKTGSYQKQNCASAWKTSFEDIRNCTIITSEEEKGIQHWAWGRHIWSNPSWQEQPSCQQQRKDLCTLYQPALLMAVFTVPSCVQQWLLHTINYRILHSHGLLNITQIYHQTCWSKRKISFIHPSGIFNFPEPPFMYKFVPYMTSFFDHTGVLNQVRFLFFFYFTLLSWVSALSFRDTV